MCYGVDLTSVDAGTRPSDPSAGLIPLVIAVVTISSPLPCHARVADVWTAVESSGTCVVVVQVGSG